MSLMPPAALFLSRYLFLEACPESMTQRESAFRSPEKVAKALDRESRLLWKEGEILHHTRDALVVCTLPVPVH